MEGNGKDIENSEEAHIVRVRSVIWMLRGMANQNIDNRDLFLLYCHISKTYRIKNNFYRLKPRRPIVLPIARQEPPNGTRTREPPVEFPWTYLDHARRGLLRRRSDRVVVLKRMLVANFWALLARRGEADKAGQYL